MLNGNRRRSNHLARNHPRKGVSPIHYLKTKHSLPTRFVHVKRPTKVHLPALQPTNTRFTPGRGTAFLKNSGDRYKRHAARIDMVSVKRTFTRISADIGVGAIKHPQMPCPRILMNWVASPLRKTQPRPDPCSGKFQPKRTIFTEHTFAVENRRCGAHVRCSGRNNPCQDVSPHGKSGSAGAPNALCPQPETCRTRYLSSSQCSTASLTRWSPQRGPHH